MANIEFTDNSAIVNAAMNEELIAWLYEQGGELAAQTIRNSRPVTYGQQDVRNSWKYEVNENNQEVKVGSTLEASYWEELGTGSYALNNDGRKGWWVYVKDNDTPKENQKYYTEAEARDVAAYLRSEKGLDAYATNGTEANRPLFKAFTSLEPKIKKNAEERLKARFEK